MALSLAMAFLICRRMVSTERFRMMEISLDVFPAEAQRRHSISRGVSLDVQATSI